LQFQFLDHVGVFVFAESLVSLLLGDLCRGRLEDHFLSAGLVSLGDLDVFFEVGDDNAIKLFERRTDVRFAGASCDAGHCHFIRLRFCICGDAELDHANRQKSDGCGNYFIHGVFNSIVMVGVQLETPARIERTVGKARQKSSVRLFPSAFSPQLGVAGIFHYSEKLRMIRAFRAP
jgi:hypothetical protein